MSTINEIFTKLSDIVKEGKCLDSGLTVQDLMSSDIHVFVDVMREVEWSSLIDEYRSFLAMVVPVNIRTLPEVHVLGVNKSLVPEYYLSVDYHSYKVQLLLSRDRENWDQLTSLNAQYKLYYVWDMASEISAVFEILASRKLYRDDTVKDHLIKIRKLLIQLVIQAYDYGLLVSDLNDLLYIQYNEDFESFLRKSLLRLYSHFMCIVAEVRLYERYK